MEGPATGTKNICSVVEQTPIEDMKNQAYGYFGLLGIGNALAPISSPLALSEITYLYEGTQTQAIYLTGCYYI